MSIKLELELAKITTTTTIAYILIPITDGEISEIYTDFQTGWQCGGMDSSLDSEVRSGSWLSFYLAL